MLFVSNCRIVLSISLGFGCFPLLGVLDLDFQSEMHLSIEAIWDNKDLVMELLKFPLFRLSLALSLGSLLSVAFSSPFQSPVR